MTHCSSLLNNSILIMKHIKKTLLLSPGAHCKWCNGGSNNHSCLTPMPHTPEWSQCYMSAAVYLYGTMNQALLTVPQPSKCQEWTPACSLLLITFEARNLNVCSFSHKTRQVLPHKRFRICSRDHFKPQEIVKLFWKMVQMKNQVLSITT